MEAACSQQQGGQGQQGNVATITQSDKSAQESKDDKGKDKDTGKTTSPTVTKSVTKGVLLCN